uniref:Olfactory receptor n=1 Tax=Gopherus agassizii TaxID=38772 RepID=A0A452GRQ6_9SAUR
MPSTECTVPGVPWNQIESDSRLFLLFIPSKTSSILHFVVFLVIYLAAVMGNLLIITAVAIDHHLHSPMYFFPDNLSFLDACYISVTVPKSMVNSLTNTRLISFSGCVAQVYFGIFAFSELVLLAAMAYDRYVAICHPLRYRVIMTRGACAQMAAGSWLSSCIYSLLHSANTFLLPFCGSNVLDQFFCNIPELLKISCADTSANEIVDILCSAVVGLFFLISILSAVLRIPSAKGTYKAFSTCLPHLVVFSLFISTGIYTYLRLGSQSSQYQGMLATMLYSVRYQNIPILRMVQKHFPRITGTY